MQFHASLHGHSSLNLSLEIIFAMIFLGGIWDIFHEYERESSWRCFEFKWFLYCSWMIIVRVSMGIFWLFLVQRMLFVNRTRIFLLILFWYLEWVCLYVRLLLWISNYFFEQLLNDVSFLRWVSRSITPLILTTRLTLEVYTWDQFLGLPRLVG